jgi:hypothetical protein
MTDSADNIGQIYYPWSMVIKVLNCFKQEAEEYWY